MAEKSLLSHRKKRDNCSKNIIQNYFSFEVLLKRHLFYAQEMITSFLKDHFVFDEGELQLTHKDFNINNVGRTLFIKCKKEPCKADLKLLCDHLSAEEVHIVIETTKNTYANKIVSLIFVNNTYKIEAEQNDEGLHIKRYFYATDISTFDLITYSMYNKNK